MKCAPSGAGKCCSVAAAPTYAPVSAMAWIVRPAPSDRSAKTRSEANVPRCDHVRPPSVEPTSCVGADFEPGTGESDELRAAKTRLGSSSSTAIAWTVTLPPPG